MKGQGFIQGWGKDPEIPSKVDSSTLIHNNYYINFKCAYYP